MKDIEHDPDVKFTKFHEDFQTQFLQKYPNLGETPKQFSMFPETVEEWHSSKREEFSMTIDGQKYDGFVFPSIRALFRECPMPERVEDADIFVKFSMMSTRLLLNAIGLKLIPIPTDDELADIFSALRRRPDGRPISFTHVLIWKSAVCHLLLYPCSQELFEAVCLCHEHIMKRIREGSTSRNYIYEASQAIEKMNCEESED